MKCSAKSENKRFLICNSKFCQFVSLSVWFKFDLKYVCYDALKLFSLYVFLVSLSRPVYALLVQVACYFSLIFLRVKRIPSLLSVKCRVDVLLIVFVF